MQYIFKLIKILCCVILLSIYASGNSSVLANSKNNQNIIKLSIPDSPSTLDPTYSLDAHANEILRNLFEGLVVRDINGNMVPGVAESWTNKDNKIWTFKLRKNVKWSDGKSVTAHDFVYAFQRVADPKTATPLAGSLIEVGYKNAEAIAKGELPVSALGVKALDDYTLEITLEKSISYFIEIAGTVPLRKDIIEKYGDRWTHPENFISNGAYKLDELILQEKVVLSKNPYYWDNKNTSIDKVVYLVISDDNIAYNRFKIGEIDIVNVNTPKNLYERAKKEYLANLDVYPRLGIFYLGVDVKKIPNKKVRQALQLGVDREVITNKILATGQKPAYNYVPYNIKGANFAEPEWAKWTAEQRYAKAKRLLAEAGFNKNHPFSLTLTYASSGELGPLIAVAIQSMYKKNIGVEVKLEHMEWKTFLQERRAGNLETWFIGGGAGFNDALTFLNPYLTGHSANASNYSNVVYDDLIRKSYTAKDSEERRSLLQKAEYMLLDEAIIIPLYYPINNLVVKPWVKGLGKNPFGLPRVNLLYLE